MQSVTSNAVAEILRPNANVQNFKVLVSKYTEDTGYGNAIFHEKGKHSYLVFAQALASNSCCEILVNTDGTYDYQIAIRPEWIHNTNNDWSYDYNSQGTFLVKATNNPDIMYKYTIGIIQLV